jgi:hypothetical protein
MTQPDEPVPQPTDGENVIKETPIPKPQPTGGESLTEQRLRPRPQPTGGDDKSATDLSKL